VLRRGQRSGEGHGDSVRDGPDHDDAPGGDPQHREKGLCDRQLTDDVDLELPSEPRQRHQFQRIEGADAGVVDEYVESASTGMCRHRCDGRRDVFGFGNVHDQWGEYALRLPLERFAVGGAPDRGEHMKAVPGQFPRRCPADAGRGTGDHGVLA
jgi:hypothetical protein